MLPILIVLLVIIIGGGILVYIGLRNPQTSDERTLQARLEEFNQKGEQVNLEKLEMSRPFTERVIYPVARKLGELAIKVTPQNQLQNISHKLEQAGSPGRMDPTIFLAIQFITLIFFGGVIILVFTLGQSNLAFWKVILLSLLFGMIGFFIPRLWLTSRIQRRQKSVRKALPDALDLFR